MQQPKDNEQKPGDEVAPGTAQSGENSCRRCSGSGRLDREACPECSGTGRVTVLIGDA
jgi:DnaJ-class molecular chaperone